MKNLYLQMLFVGNKVREVKLEVDENNSIKQIIDLNFQDIFPYSTKSEVLKNDSWEEFDKDYLRNFHSNYNFSIYQNINNELIAVHLIDKVKHLESDKLTIGSPGIRVDESIIFYIIQKHQPKLNELIIKSKEEPFNSELFTPWLDEIFSEVDSHLLIDNYIRSQSEHELDIFIKQFIPSTLWYEINKENMNYYAKFIIFFVSQICLLNYCIKNINIENDDILNDINRSWVNNFLYRIQNLMLVTLNIPEITMRNINPINYTKALKKANIDPFCSMEDEMDQIKNKSISEVYLDIFKENDIKSYYDYLSFCMETDLHNTNLRRIVHVLRIFFNKLKHSSYVEIIKSRNEDDIRKKKIEKIDLKIEKLKLDFSKEDIEKELRHLEIEKEIIEKVRYKYANLDFSDSEFKQRNGILVYGENSDQVFKITLFDLEFSIKILIGILCILKRTPRK